MKAQSLQGTDYNLNEFDSKIDNTYDAALEDTGYENEFGIKVSNMSAGVCSKIMDMDWQEPVEITGNTNCEAEVNALTFAFATGEESTDPVVAETTKECTGTQPACQKCDTGTGNWIADSDKDNTPCEAVGLCKTGECKVCLNGGSWNGNVCECSMGFTGDYCETLENKCQNGGYWDGVACQCTPLYYGPLCEFPVEII